MDEKLTHPGSELWGGDLWLLLLGSNVMVENRRVLAFFLSCVLDFLVLSKWSMSKDKCCVTFMRYAQRIQFFLRGGVLVMLFVQWRQRSICIVVRICIAVMVVVDVVSSRVRYANYFAYSFFFFLLCTIAATINARSRSFFLFFSFFSLSFLFLLFACICMCNDAHEPMTMYISQQQCKRERERERERERRETREEGNNAIRATTTIVLPLYFTSFAFFFACFFSLSLARLLVICTYICSARRRRHRKKKMSCLHIRKRNKRALCVNVTVKKAITVRSEKRQRE